MSASSVPSIAMRRAIFAAFTLVITATFASAANVDAGAMPPFLIGAWRMGEPIMFAPPNRGYSRPEVDTLRRLQGTMYITKTSISFDPKIVPHVSGKKVSALADERPLNTFAKLDPSEAAGTPLADANANVAIVQVTPADCPKGPVTASDASGQRICAQQLFFSPDGFQSLVYLWEPGAVLPLARVRRRP